MPARPNFHFPMRLGFGCAGALAQRWHGARATEKVLLAALDGGVRHFDTAPFYADGEAERRLGAALRNFGEAVFVSTKTGTRRRLAQPALKDFSKEAIRRDVEASLKRLGRERLDLLYLHGPSAEEQTLGFETIARLKEEGKVALAGVCAEGEGLSRAVAAEGVDVVMGVYNLFYRAHAPIFARAKAKGLGVVAVAPLAQGLYNPALLAPRNLADGWRLARALVKNRAALARARAARPTLDSVAGLSPAQLALAFVHADPAIDVAVMTTTRPAHLAEILAGAGAELAPDLLERLAGLDGARAGA